MQKVKLITENFDHIQLNESEDGKDLYATGIYSTAELDNKNGRKYRKKTLEREVNRLSEEIKNKSLYGELNHPSSPEVDLKNVAILVESLKWEGNNLFGKSIVLETPMGDIAKAIMRKGKIGISSRGLGSVNEDGYVNDQSYKLITWDLVGSPSNIPSWVNGIYEAKEWILADSGEIIEEESKLNKKEKKEAQEEAEHELSVTLTPKLIQFVAEDKKISLDEANKVYLMIIKDSIKNIVSRI